MKAFGTGQQPVDHAPARRPLVDVVADRDDGIPLALRSRGNFGEAVAQQIETAMDVGDDEGLAHR